MRITIKQITITATLLAICLVSQFFKNISVYITGPIVNVCIIIAALSAGLACGIILSVITPVTAFFIAGTPIVAAIPAVMPCIMIGNAILASFVWFFYHKRNDQIKLIVGMALGSICKALFMGIAISLILVPNFLPEKMMPKMKVFQITFSVTQLITAITGSVLAYLIWMGLKNTVDVQEED